MLSESEFEIRVRYQETDAQGHVHHANYLTYFETGRTEQLRSAGYRGSLCIENESLGRYPERERQGMLRREAAYLEECLQG